MAVTTRNTVTLDVPTIWACAKLARDAADAIPRARAHYSVASAALEAFADQLDELTAPQANGDVPA